MPRKYLILKKTNKNQALRQMYSPTRGPSQAASYSPFFKLFTEHMLSLPLIYALLTYEEKKPDRAEQIFSVP